MPLSMFFLKYSLSSVCRYVQHRFVEMQFTTIFFAVLSWNTVFKHFKWVKYTHILQILAKEVLTN